MKVLVTSRASLHLSGEHEFVVPPLSLPDLRDLPPLDRLTQFEAVRLFIERAQAVQSDFAMTGENAAAVAAICHEVDGLPLAIELAAGRSKLFSPQALLPRLKSRLKLLVGGARDRPLHQQTLRGTIAWSYDLLEEDEKTLFRQLAVFVGGCTLEAAEAVCNTHGDLGVDVLDAVAGLVDKSLLRQETQADGEPRLLMLETIREYALERLKASGEAEAMQRRHTTYFLAMAEQSDLKLRSAEQSIWRRRLVVEQDNLRAALRWTLESQEVEMGLQLAGALHPFWRICLNRPREGRSWLEQVLAQSGAQARTAARARALRAAGAMAYYQGDFPEAHRLLEESVMVSREVGAAAREDLAYALVMLGLVVLLQGEPSGTYELAGESLHMFQEAGETWGIAMVLLTLGRATADLGDLMAAHSLIEESAVLFRGIGDRRYQMVSVDVLGLVALRQGMMSVRVPTSRKSWESHRRWVTSHSSQTRWLIWEPSPSAWETFRRPQCSTSRVLHSIGKRETEMVSFEDLAGLTEVAGLLGHPERAAWLLGAVEALKQHYGGLTTREREVAQQVAQGKSNRAIADELVVGVSTVEAHITHILTKLGFSSRAQIAVWAVEVGLAQGSQDVEVTRQEH